MADTFKNKKIVYVDTCHDVAGGQRSLIALLTNIKDKINYSILIDKDNSKYESELLKAGIPVEKIYKINSKPFNQRWLGGISLFARSLKLATNNSLVHCNTFYDGLFSMPAFRIFGKKAIFRARCGIDMSNHGIVDKAIYLFSSVILANSEYVKSTFKRVSSDLSKIVALYNPLDMKFNQKPNEELLGENPNKYVVAVIGAITEVKRQKEVLEAFAELKDDEIILRFIGEPRSTDKDRAYYQELIQLVKEKNIENNVEFTGFISDVRDKLGDVDLICVPSDREPLGRVIFESQLYEIPVLASLSGGNSELIEEGETGYLYELGNIKQLSEKLLFAKNNNDSLNKKAKEFVLKRFSPELTYLAELKIYNDLVR